MEVKAKLRYLKIAPRKVRLVADQMRGESVAKSKGFLTFTIKKATEPLLKLLNSAVANAKNNFNLEESNLYISEIRVDEGPKMKRWMPRARGLASKIEKKTSHITLTLSEIKETAKRTKKKSEAISVSKVSEIKDIVDEKKTKWKKGDGSVKKLTEKITPKKMFRRKSI